MRKGAAKSSIHAASAKVTNFEIERFDNMIKRLRITVEGKAYDVTVEVMDDGQPRVSSPQPVAPAAVPAAAPAPAAPAPKPPPVPVSAGAGDVPSPLAGRVVSVDVRVGSTVNEGQNVITLEAMKMNTYVTAPSSGTVTAIHVSVGDSVEEGQSLMSIG